MTGRPAYLGLWAVTMALIGVSTAPAAPARASALNFNRDIRPILSDNCYHCHGPDEKDRKAGLRLDTREGATADRDGSVAIVPGKSGQSLLYKRITTQDQDDVMPPPASHKKLTPQQIAILKEWIDQGAEYQPHWAFIAPKPPPVPEVKQKSWPKTRVDHFILAALEARGLKPAKEAPKEVLLRRLKFDLTGLPPTPAEVDEFLKDSRPGAYERQVDKFMSQAAYGEHQARYWLDAVRYGDTHGLHLDNERSMWPYRDWVVRAFNQNKPFDQFTIEQLAGDLLPNANRDQLTASGYNRANVTTSEGGAIDEEFYVRYAVDRTETTATVWMGMTMGCAVCHDHKFDPVSQKEFYRLYAFFNNAADKAMDGNALLPPPSIKLPLPAEEQQLAEYDKRIGELDKRLTELTRKIEYTDPATVTNRPPGTEVEKVWIEDDFPAGAKPGLGDKNPPLQWVRATNGPVFSGERALKRTDEGLAQDFFTTTNSHLVVGPGAKFFAHVYLDPTNPPKAIMLQFHSGTWDHRASWGEKDAIAYGAGKDDQRTHIGALPATGAWVRIEVEASKVGLNFGDKVDGFAFAQFGGTVYWDKAGISTNSDPALDPAQSQKAWIALVRALGKKSKVPDNIIELAKISSAKRTADQARRLLDHYLQNTHAASKKALAPAVADLKKERDLRNQLDATIPNTMVMREREKPKPAHVLKRGAYDAPGEVVQPGVPAMFPPLPASSTTNRLDLARWLVSPEHPLTARVAVNRFWQQFFGVGIVKTANDFGMQSEWPSNPELLDWLATEFMASGWDIRKFQRLLLTSAAYRQDSTVTPKLLEVDPENRLVSRGPRFRLDAEAIRDNALFVSGLLNPAMGGRGVRPYQPPGIWEAVAYTTSTTAKYTQDKGDALYRRSLYVFWKRTAPPPIFTIADAPSRESACVRRERSNTPLQALLLMNDVTYVEAARHLAGRMMTEGGRSPADRLRYGFRLVTSRYPTAREMSILRDSLDRNLVRYRDDPEAAKQLLATGEKPSPESLDPAELAAYTLVGNVLLNLDETVTKN